MSDNGMLLKTFDSPQQKTYLKKKKKKACRAIKRAEKQGYIQGQ